MATTSFERLRQEGTLKGQREFAQMLLAERFGPLSPCVQEQVQSMAAERLAELGRALLKATSLRELGLEE
jgi:hypothetical protein